MCFLQTVKHVPLFQKIWNIIWNMQIKDQIHVYTSLFIQRNEPFLYILDVLSLLHIVLMWFFLWGNRTCFFQVTHGNTNILRANFVTVDTCLRWQWQSICKSASLFVHTSHVLEKWFCVFYKKQCPVNFQLFVEMWIHPSSHLLAHFVSKQCYEDLLEPMSSAHRAKTKNRQRSPVHHIDCMYSKRWM